MSATKTTLLAIDASTEVCSVALQRDGKGGCISRSCDTPKSHAKVLLPLIQELLDEGCLSLNDIDAIIVSLGPGSFTGIRISLSIAQGLAYGLGLPIYGLSTLEVMAQGLSHQQGITTGTRVLPALDARMGEVYWAAYDHTPEGLVECHGPTVSAPESLVQYRTTVECETIGGGHGWTVAASGGLNHAVPEFFPHAEDLIALAKSKSEDFWQAKPSSLGALSIEPLYLRNEVAWEKRVRIREQSDKA